MIHEIRPAKPDMHRLTARPHPTAAPENGSGASQWQLPRFLVAGLVNTGFGYTVYAILVALGSHPQLALIGQFALGILWNRAIHGRFVYGPNHHARLPVYAAAYGAVYLFNASALFALIWLGFGPYLAQAMALIPSVALSYLLVTRAFGASLSGGRAS